MKTKLIFFLFIILVLVLGCAKPPLEEMQEAREAVFRAENDANAAQFAGGTLSRARDAIRQMESEADSKRYDSARTFASEAIATAERAIAEGRTGAERDGERVRAESDSLVSGLRTEIEETSINVNGARYSLMDLDYDALDRTIVNAHNNADRAEADQAAGRYQDASDTARSVRSELANVNQMVARAAPAGKK